MADSFSSAGRLDNRDWFLLAVMTLVLNFFWAANSHFYIIDLSPLLPFIHHHHDPSLYKDALVMAVFKQYFTFYYKIAAFLSDHLSIRTVVSLMSLIPGLVIVPAVFTIGYVVLDNKYAGYLTVMMLLTNWQLKAALGGSEGFGNNLAQISFASAFLLLSLALFLKKRHVLSFLIAGAMINIHAPIALGLLAILFTCSLFDKGLGFAKILGLLLLSMIGGIPTWIWFFTVYGNQNHSPELLQQWRELTRLRSVHSLPLNWNVGQYIRFLAFAVNFVFFAAIRSRMNKQTASDFLAIVGAIGFICVIGTVFVEFYPVPLVTQLTLFRTTRFLLVVSVAVLASYAVTKIKTRGAANQEIFLVSGIIISIITWNVKIAIVFEMLFFCWLSWKYRSVKYLLLSSLILAVSVAGVFIVPKHHVYPIFDKPGLFFGVFAIFGISWLFYRLNARWRGWIPSAAVLAVFVGLAAGGSFRAYSPEQEDLLNAEKDAQLWIGKNTSKDDLFLIPPNLALWENYSKRSNFLNFTDLAFNFYDPSVTPEILKRIADYGIKIEGYRTGEALFEGMLGRYYSWSDEEIASLAKKSNITLIVVESIKRKSFGFPLVYENGFFQIYKIGM